MKYVFILGHVFSDPTADKGQNTAFVESDGTVTVADPISGERTSCHALTEEHQKAIRSARSYSTLDFRPQAAR